MTSRTWIKLYCDQCLSGSLREETPELRGIWADLLALAGSGKYGDTGRICLQNDVGLSDSQFEKMLQITKYQWQKAKKRLILTERITINQANVVTIINWQKYQSEYQRQKPYRNNKLRPKITAESYTGDREREVHIDIENNNDLILGGQSIEKAIRIARGELDAYYSY